MDSEDNFPTFYAILIRENYLDNRPIEDYPVGTMYIYPTKEEALKVFQKYAKDHKYTIGPDEKARKWTSERYSWETSVYCLMEIEKIKKPGLVFRNV